MALQDVTARIAAATAGAGRPAGAVTLVAVSKLQPPDRIEAVLAAGQRVFGENRVQEAEGKWPSLRARFPGIELHLVGPLQSNKLARALELFDAIHSLDRDGLARKLARAVQARGACPTLFVQVNTGREPQKAGVDPDALAPLLAACRSSCSRVAAASACKRRASSMSRRMRLSRASIARVIGPYRTRRSSQIRIRKLRTCTPAVNGSMSMRH